MKYIYIFVIFTALFPRHGACVSFGPPFNSTIRPADITTRGELSSLSPPLTWSGSRGLTTRADDPKTKKKLALEFAVRSGFMGIIGVGVWSAIDDCRARHEDKESTTGAKCAVGSIGTLIAIGAEGINTATLFYEIASRISTSVVEYSVNTVVGKFIGGNVGFLGPFFRTPAGLPSQSIPMKRDDSHLFKRLEGHFTSKFGVDVRHIGFWDGSVHTDSRSEVLRREQSQEGVIPVFAHTLYGQDVHFAFTGETVDGHATYKIGHGPGPATEENKRRIKARDSDSVPLFDDYFFDQGGFDMILSANIDNSQADILPDVSSNDFDYAWIYTQLMCLLGVADPRSLQGDSHPAQLDAVGMWFQMYDGEYKGTIAAGAIAAFSADTPSVIQWMQPEGDLQIDNRCSTNTGFEYSG